MPIIFAAFEIAGAELAATLAAEAAAAAAAETLAAQIAAEAGTAAAVEAGATAAAQQAAQQAAQAGIMEIGGTTAANTGAPLTAEAVQNAAMQAGQNVAPEVINTAQGLPQGFEQQLQNIQNMSQGPSVQVASPNPAAGLESLQNQQPVPAPAPAPAPNTLPMGIDMPGTYMPPSNALYTPPPTTYTAPEPNALMRGLDSVTKWAKENPFPAMATAYTGANMLGLMKPSGATFNEKGYDGPLNRYRLSPDFKPGSANPEDYQYTPRRYAEGGIMGTAPNTISVGYEQGGQMPETQDYAKGGSLSDSIDSYQKMLSGKPMAPPARSADVGIYYDQDPDTRYQDALTAAQIRQAKVNQRAYVSPPVAKRPTPMGQLQMASVKPRKQGDGGGDVEAARGGIMQSYADGGVTGEGNLNLQIPLNLGSGGGGGGGAAGGGFNGYTPAGGNVNPNNGGGGFGGGGGLGGLLQGISGLFGGGGGRPQGFMDQMQQMNQPRAPAAQNYQNIINGRGNMMVGMGGDSYDEYAASNNQRLAERNRQSGNMIMTHDYVGPTMSRDKFEAAQNAPKNPASFFAQGGITSLGDYAAGGNPRLLKGPGDGMSDNIPATINGRQPARLADGEFVIPADVVSHLGNGSTEAGAKQLHAMMDKVRSARTGNKKQGKQIKPQKYMPK